MPDDRPIDGISLMPLIEGRSLERPCPIPYRFLESEAAMFGAPTLAMVDGRFKFLTNLSTDGHEDMLFDLDADIAETIIGFNSESNALQSALNAAARVLQPSLLDFVR